MSSPLKQGWESSLLHGGDECTAPHLVFSGTNLARRVPGYTGQASQPLLVCVGCETINFSMVFGWNNAVCSKIFLSFPLPGPLARERKFLFLLGFLVCLCFFCLFCFLFVPVSVYGLLAFLSPSPGYMWEKENPGSSPPCCSPGTVISSWSAFLSPSLIIFCLFYIYLPGLVAELNGRYRGKCVYYMLLPL